MSLDQTRRDWTRLGQADPLWAVCVHPDGRGGRWNLASFFATGAREVDTAMAHLAGLGLDAGRGRALDFGAGVGRVSAALAGHFAEVVGVDVSEPMLTTARRLDRSGGRCRFVLNERPDLRMFDDASFDLVYSSLVLQHLPPRLALGYLTEMVRILRPGGVAVVQVATRPTLSVKGLLFRYAPQPLLRFGQRALLGYPAPMRMHGTSTHRLVEAVAPQGGRLVDTVAETTYGGHWRYARHFIARDNGPDQRAADQRGLG